MRISLILFCHLASATVFSQDSVKTKKIYVEYSDKKPKKDKFQFAWSKEFNKSGDLLLDLSPSQYVDSIEYEYYTDNKVKEVRKYISNPYERPHIKIIDYSYIGDTVMVCKTVPMDSSFNKCQKIIKEFDDRGNLISKLILKNDSLNIFSTYSYEEHQYEYDSLNRINKKYSNCRQGDNCEIAEYTYDDDTLNIESREYSTIRITGFTNDTVYKTELYTYFPNDTIATKEFYSYSSKVQSRIGLYQKFSYDAKGNITEFRVYEYQNGEAKLYTHYKYSYEYNQNSDIVSKVYQTILPKISKGKYYYRYSYEYW